jgi:hypothetical protein
MKKEIVWWIGTVLVLAITATCIVKSRQVRLGYEIEKLRIERGCPTEVVE